MRTQLKFILSAFVALSTYSCVKDKPALPSQPSIQQAVAGKVYIVNEGNFMAGNASVSLYDPISGNVVENYYRQQNNSALGDVAQSMTHFNSHFYLVINNSSKIIVCNEQLQQQVSISEFPSPRYFLPVSNAKAYVSDLYANFISVLNLNTKQVSTVIPCVGATEKMVLLFNKVFVCNSKSNYLYVLNSITDTKTDSIAVGPGAADLVIDKNDRVWVLSAGDALKSVAPALTMLNAVSLQVEKSFHFALNEWPNQLCLNKTKDTLYFLNKGVYRMAVGDAGLPADALVPAGSKNFYGLGVNPRDHTIYVADALDYIQRSNIYVYDANGHQKTFFKAGINANSFYFDR
jgi:YVTN family beta-propeller protein